MRSICNVFLALRATYLPFREDGDDEGALLWGLDDHATYLCGIKHILHSALLFPLTDFGSPLVESLGF